MMACAKLAILSLLFLAGVQGESVWKALESSSEKIDQFLKLIKDMNQQSQLDSSDCKVTNCNSAFIPTNAALARKFPSNGLAKLTEQEKIKLVKIHICRLVNKNNQQIKMQTSAFTSPNVLQQGTEINFGTNVKAGKYIELMDVAGEKLYWTRKVNGSVTTYYVNNAVMKPSSEEVAAGGTYFIMDDVIWPPPVGQSVVNFMEANKDKYSEFLNFFQTYAKATTGINTNIQGKIVTAYQGRERQSMTSFFIPENPAFASFTETNKTALKTNLTKLQEFLVSHMASDQLVFISWMRNQPPINLKMKSSDSSVKSYEAKMYSENNATSNYISCGGVTAKIYDEGQPLVQSLLFRISQPLNFLISNLASILQKKSNLFYSLCVANTKCKNLLESGQVTVFAPSPSVALPNLNATLTEKLLLLHILPGKRLPTPEMRKGMKETIPGIGDLRFLPGDDNRMYVSGRFLYKVGKNGYEQGYVGSPISEPNLAATGGIVHVIQQPIGFATQSIYDLLQSRYSLFSILVGYLKEFDLTESLKKVPENGQHYTFFAPTNAAFAKMTDKIGKQILNDVKIRNRLLKRLLLLNVVVLSNLKLDKKYAAVTALPYENQQNLHVNLSITTSMNRMKLLQTYVQDDSATVSLLPGDSGWGGNNGIVYALDTVPYNGKSVDRVCKPEGSTCGSQRLFSHGFWILLITTAAAMALHLD